MADVEMPVADVSAVKQEDMTSADYYFDSYAHFGKSDDIIKFEKSSKFETILISFELSWSEKPPSSDLPFS